MIRIKRVYEGQARGDGTRILVERLWPRGMRKAAVGEDLWLKEIAPSTALRQWYGHRVDRWPEFRRRYRQELRAHRGELDSVLAKARRGNVTLLYSAHDPQHNSAVVLRELLARARRRA